MEASWGGESQEDVGKWILALVNLVHSKMLCVGGVRWENAQWKGTATGLRGFGKILLLRFRQMLEIARLRGRPTLWQRSVVTITTEAV